MPEVPTFDAFFRAANEGRKPFPWQRNLADQVAQRGWPDAIGVPTGLGKTACLDIAVWALARAAGPRRSVPTRIWYVVNRRLLIDAAHDHAVQLQKLLADPAGLRQSWPEATDHDVQALEAVAGALKNLVVTPLDDGPLHVARLRGGAELGARPPDPAQPCLILATVPMFASRLLFRGYGSSTSMRPVDAALAGIDSLVLLDEAHLARPLARLVALAAKCDLGDPEVLLPDGRTRCRLVALTATGEEKGERFDLGPEDYECEELLRRLRASKPAELVATTDQHQAGTLASQARELLAERPGSTCVIFCNTVGRAREVMGALEDLVRRTGWEADLELLTGRVREREAEGVRRRLMDPVWGAPSRRDSEHPYARRARDLVVVSTQTLEVGADLDFDFLVTESAGARAVIQRLGRLNRLGKRPHARAAICHPGDVQVWTPYGTEPEQVWKRLLAAGQELDLAPERVSGVVGQPEDQPPEVAELLPDHLWELAKTSFTERDQPPVELFFEGVDADPGVSICWRSYLPKDGEKLVPPVREAESVEVPAGELRQVLREKGMTDVRRLAADRSRLETVDPAELRPGDQVVLPVSAGLYDTTGWNPKATGPVLDVATFDAGLLWLDMTALQNLVPGAPDDLCQEMRRVVEDLRPSDFEQKPEELDPEQEEELIGRLLEILALLAPHPWLGEAEWSEYLARLRGGRLVRDDRRVPLYLEAPQKKQFRDRLRLRADALEELSFEASSTLLTEHLGAVSEQASRVARHLGLPDIVVGSLEQAGRFHDLGKHDLRFQRWLDPEAMSSAPLAKSSVPRERSERDRKASGWPRGGRHELLSVRLLRRYLADHSLGGCDPDLVIHLVATHHGHGRPWIALAEDDAPPAISVEMEGAHLLVPGDLHLPDWEQPRRFRKLCERYGLWGLSLLEAILRQADHVASQAVEVI